jgi:hypothetical protein
MNGQNFYRFFPEKLKTHASHHIQKAVDSSAWISVGTKRGMACKEQQLDKNCQSFPNLKFTACSHSSHVEVE